MDRGNINKKKKYKKPSVEVIGILTNGPMMLKQSPQSISTEMFMLYQEDQDIDPNKDGIQTTYEEDMWN